MGDVHVQGLVPPRPYPNTKPGSWWYNITALLDTPPPPNCHMPTRGDLEHQELPRASVSAPTAPRAALLLVLLVTGQFLHW